MSSKEGAKQKGILSIGLIALILLIAFAIPALQAEQIRRKRAEEEMNGALTFSMTVGYEDGSTKTIDGSDEPSWFDLLFSGLKPQTITDTGGKVISWVDYEIKIKVTWDSATPSISNYDPSPSICAIFIGELPQGPPVEGIVPSFPATIQKDKWYVIASDRLPFDDFEEWTDISSEPYTMWIWADIFLFLTEINPYLEVTGSGTATFDFYHKAHATIASIEVEVTRNPM